MQMVRRASTHSLPGCVAVHRRCGPRRRFQALRASARRRRRPDIRKSNDNLLEWISWTPKPSRRPIAAASSPPSKPAASPCARRCKAQLQGSGDDRVVGLRNRLDETDDWAVADSLAELDIAGLRHALKDLTEVDAALGRMRDGSYGECIDCGEPIAPARLSAYPTATRCLECQRTHEARPDRT